MPPPPRLSQTSRRASLLRLWRAEYQKSISNGPKLLETVEPEEDGRTHCSPRGDNKDVAMSRHREGTYELDTPKLPLSPDSTSNASRATTGTKNSCLLPFDLSTMGTMSDLDDLPYKLPSPLGAKPKKKVSTDSDTSDIEVHYETREECIEATDTLGAMSPVPHSLDYSTEEDNGGFNKPEAISTFLHIPKGFQSFPLSPMTYDSDYPSDTCFFLGRSDSPKYKDFAIEQSQYPENNVTEDISRSFLNADDDDDTSQLELIAIVEMIQSNSTSNDMPREYPSENSGDKPKENVEMKTKMAVGTPAAASSADVITSTFTNINANTMISQFSSFGYDDFLSTNTLTMTSENASVEYDCCPSMLSLEESSRSALLDCRDFVTAARQRISTAIELFNGKESAMKSNIHVVQEPQAAHGVQMNEGSELVAGVSSNGTATVGPGEKEILQEERDDVGGSSEHQNCDPSAKGTPASMHINANLDRVDDTERRDSPEHEVYEDEVDHSSAKQQATETRPAGGGPPLKMTTREGALSIRSKSLSPLIDTATHGDKDKALILSTCTSTSAIKGTSIGTKSFPTFDDSDALSDVSVDSCAFVMLAGLLSRPSHA